MPTREFSIRCEWDPDAAVWYVAESDVPGLSVEAPTVEQMTVKLRAAVADLLELNMPELQNGASLERPETVPLHLMWRRDEQLRLRNVR